MDNTVKCNLMRELQEADFALYDTVLYLNTHPNCTAALDYYTKTVDALDELMRRYHEGVGPLFASGVTGTGGWTWIKGPWPWQTGAGTRDGKES